MSHMLHRQNLMALISFVYVRDLSTPPHESRCEQCTSCSLFNLWPGTIFCTNKRWVFFAYGRTGCKILTFMARRISSVVAILILQCCEMFVRNDVLHMIPNILTLCPLLRGSKCVQTSLYNINTRQISMIPIPIRGATMFLPSSDQVRRQPCSSIVDFRTDPKEAPHQGFE